MDTELGVLVDSLLLLQASQGSRLGLVSWLELVYSKDLANSKLLVKTTYMQPLRIIQA